jgi:hypothetical protein
LFVVWNGGGVKGLTLADFETVAASLRGNIGITEGDTSVIKDLELGARGGFYCGDRHVSTVCSYIRNGFGRLVAGRKITAA